MIQPPRGFGENPIAIYHDPDLPPSHHYLAAYRWLDARRSAPTPSSTSASTARWSGCRARASGCPRRARPTPCSATCRWSTRSSSTTPARAPRPSAAAHATVVDHLVPPMARADTYGDLAKLEQLLDEYATVAGARPGQAARRCAAQIWDAACEAAQLHHDLHVDEPARRGRVRRLRPARRRLPVRDQGRPDPRRAAHPRRRARTARRGSTWCSRCCAPRRCGAARRARCRACGGAADVGLDERRCWPSRAHWRSASTDGSTAGSHGRRRVDGWSSSRGGSSRHGGARLGRRAAAASPRRWAGRRRRRRGAATSPRPRSCRGWPAPPTRSTTPARRSTAATCRPGPSGSPTRGLVNVLPTGRNFYSVDPKAIPSRLPGRSARRSPTRCWPRHLADTGEYPRVGRARRCGARRAMRTQGDDIAEVLALLGVPPGRGTTRRAGSPASRSSRSTELGRPAHRRDGAHLRLLPRRLPARRRAARRRGPARSPRSTSRPSNFVRAHVAADVARARRPAARDRADLRLQARRLRRRACCR